MHKVMKFLDIIDSINTWACNIFRWVVLIITAVLMYEVIARYVFSSPTVWAGEVALQLFTLLVVMAGGYALLHDRHVRMDAIYSRLSPRGKATVDAVLFIAFLLFSSVLLWKFAQMGWTSIKVRELAATYFAPPLYPVKSTLAVGTFLLLLQGVAWFIRSIWVAKGHTVKGMHSEH